MSSPRRILEDPSASSSLRSDLQSTVESETSYDPSAGFARLQSALVSAAASEPPPDADPAPFAEASNAATAAGVAGAPVATKLLLAAAIGGAAALGYGVFSPPADWTKTAAVKSPEVKAPAEAPSAPTKPPEPGPPPSDTAPPSAVPPSAAPTTETRASSARSASQREIAQLVRIRALLERDPARAHRSIVASSREFPDGVFAEERAGLDVIALYRSGERQRATAAARRFIALYPKSPLRPTLERILAGEAP